MSIKTRTRSQWCSIIFVGAIAWIGTTASANNPEPNRSRHFPHPTSVSQTFAERTELPHGVAGDLFLVFTTEPLAGNVIAFNRYLGTEKLHIPAPPGGFSLPFQVKTPYPGRLVVLDSGGFPDPSGFATPKIYDYDYFWSYPSNSWVFNLVRTVDFSGIPIGFSEDFSITQGNTYILSDSVLGALWLVQADGSIVPGIVPQSPAPEHAIPELSACPSTPIMIGDTPFDIVGGFAPGVGFSTVHEDFLYFGSTCTGGLARVEVSVFFDSRPSHERVDAIEVVSPRPPNIIESLKSPVFRDGDDRVYVADTFNFRILRIDVDTGHREVIAEDPQLFNFPVSLAFLPKVFGSQPLITVSDQEQNFAAINAAIPADQFELPFRITRTWIRY